MASDASTRRFSGRAFTATGAFFAGLCLACTGLLMEAAEEGGLPIDKHQMASLHWYLALTFLVFAGNHIRLNWRPLVAHVKRRAAAAQPRLEWVLAGVLVALIGVTALATTPGEARGERQGEAGERGHDD